MPTFLRRVAIGLAAAAAFLGLMAGGMLVFVHTATGAGMLARALAEALSAPGRPAAVAGLRVEWPFTLRADEITLADARGAWLRIRSPLVAWHPWRLLDGRVDFDRIVVAQVDVLRLPAAAEPGASPSLPRVGLRVGEISVPVVLHRPVLGETLRLKVGGSVATGGTVDVDARADDDTRLHATGTAGTDYLDLRWYLQVPELARWQGLLGVPASGGLVVDGFSAGRLPRPVIGGEAMLGEGGIDGLAWQAARLSVRAVPSEAGPWGVAASAEVLIPHAVGGVPPVPGVTLALAGDVAPDRGRIRLGWLRLQAGPLRARAFGVLERWGQGSAVVVDGDIRLPQGRVRLNGQVGGDIGHPTVVAAVRGEGIATGLPALDALLGPRPAGRVLARPGPGRTWAAVALAGSGATLRAQGLAWPRLGVWAGLELHEQPGAVLLGRVVGPPADPAVFGVAEPRGLPEVSGRLGFNLAGLGSHPAGAVAVDGNARGHPFSGSARVAFGPGVRVEALDVVSGAARLRGHLAVVDGRVAGQVSGRVPDLAAWRDVTGLPVTGRLDLQAELASGRGPSAWPEIDGHLLLGDVAWGAARLDHASVRLRGGPARLEVALRGHGLPDVAARGIVRVAGSGGAMRLEALDLAGRGHRLRLVGPAVVEWAAEQVRLAPARLAVDDGRVELEGDKTGRRISGRLRLANLPLAAAAVVRPDMDLAGRLAGRLTLAGTLDDPTAEIRLSGRGLGWGGQGGLDGRVEATWRRQRLSLQAQATASGLSADIRGALPLPLAPGGAQGGAVSGRLHADGALDRLVGWLPQLDSYGLGGQVSADAAVSGTLAAPRFSGSAVLTGGRAELAGSGTVLRDVRAAASLNGETVTVQADGSDGGTGRAHARFGWGLAAGLDGEVVLQDFRAVRRDDIKATVSGHLGLDERDGTLALTGELMADRAEVDIGRMHGGDGVTALPVTEINLPAGTAGTPAPSSPPLRIPLAVGLAVERAFVRGHGLDSEWKGHLDVGGTADQPHLGGRLQVVRGTLDFVGRSFRLKPDGSVAFTGGPPEQAALDVSADATARDITATVHLTGTAGDPEVEFTSDPPLPTEEILARVLFNQDSGKLSTFQQLQLAQLAATGLGLGGGGGGFDPVGRLRGALGLDTLQVSGGEDSGASRTGPSLSLGKYVGPDTFVRVEQGLSGLGRVTVEEEVGGGFALSSSVGQQGGSGVGLNWRLDY